MPQCDPSTTKTLNITRNSDGTYSVDNQNFGVPLNWCLTIKLHNQPSAGVEFDFTPAYPFGGSKFQRKDDKTDGPFTATQTYTYTVKDWSGGAQTPGANRVQGGVGSNTIQVGSSTGD